jgi:hypothetical protein
VERFLRRSFQLPACAFSLPFDSSPLLFRFPMPLPCSLTYPENLGMPIRHYYRYCTLRSPNSSLLKYLSHESHHVPPSHRTEVDTKTIISASSPKLADSPQGFRGVGNSPSWPRYFHVAVRPAKSSAAEPFPKSYSDSWWLNSLALAMGYAEIQGVETP